MKTILATGGLGFLGSHTCVSLLNEGHRIIIIDSLIIFSAPLIKGGKCCTWHVEVNAPGMHIIRTRLFLKSLCKLKSFVPSEETNLRLIFGISSPSFMI